MDLPLPLLGIFRARILSMSDTSGKDVPWAEEIQFEIFSESIGIAPYSEVLIHNSLPFKISNECAQIHFIYHWHAGKHAWGARLVWSMPKYDLT